MLLSETHTTEPITKLREQVRTRILQSKSSYAIDNEKIRIIEPGTEIYIRYSSKSPRIRGKILQDFGFTAKIQKTDHKGRYGVIRVAKRHIFEILNVNNLEIMKHSFRM